MIPRCVSGFLGAAVLVACSGKSVVDPGAGGAASNGAGGSPGNTSVVSTGSTASGGVACRHQSPETGRFCVRGTPVNGGEELVVGGPVRFELRPVGCYSGTCTKIHDVSCQVGEASDDKFELRASFCLEDTSDSFTGCTADCGGGGLAECQVDSVGRGDYVATVDGLTLQFAVGSVLPSGGACVGR